MTENSKKIEKWTKLDLINFIQEWKKSIENGREDLNDFIKLYGENENKISNISNMVDSIQIFKDRIEELKSQSVDCFEELKSQSVDCVDGFEELKSQSIDCFEELESQSEKLKSQSEELESQSVDCFEELKSQFEELKSKSVDCFEELKTEVDESKKEIDLYYSKLFTSQEKTDDNLDGLSVEKHLDKFQENTKLEYYAT